MANNAQYCLKNKTGLVTKRAAKYQIFQASLKALFRDRRNIYIGALGEFNHD